MHKLALFNGLLLGFAMTPIACSDSGGNGTGGTGGGSGSDGSGGDGAGGTGGGGTIVVGPRECNADPLFDDTDALLQVAGTDPAKSVTMEVGGVYAMPDTAYKGNCFSYADTGGSKIYPPCGSDYCFTVSSHLCLAASLGSGSTTTWGGGFGCNMNQPSGTPLFTDVKGKTTFTIKAYGCKIPDKLQLQLNVVNAPDTDAGVPGSGYFCKLVDMSAPDVDGVRTGTVSLTELVQDCWQSTSPTFDPETMLVKSLQVQINALEGSETKWDFCVSELKLQ